MAIFSSSPGLFGAGTSYSSIPGVSSVSSGASGRIASPWARPSSAAPSTTSGGVFRAPRNPTSQTYTGINNQSTNNTNSTLNTNTTTNSNQTQTDVRDLQSVTDPILAAIEAAVAGMGQNSTLNRTDLAREQNMNAILDRIQGFDQSAIMSGAEGEVSQLNRQLMEDVLPQITGAVEASGASNSALAGLLANDAASRTAEAGARVREQARSNSAAEFINMINSATNASSGGSARNDAMVDMTNAAKGIVDQGTSSSATAGTQTETQRAIGSETVEGTQQQEGISSEQDAAVADAISQGADANELARLAMLQSTLSPFQTLQDLTYNSTRTGNTGFGDLARTNSRQSINDLARALGI